MELAAEVVAEVPLDMEAEEQDITNDDAEGVSSAVLGCLVARGGLDEHLKTSFVACYVDKLGKLLSAVDRDDGFEKNIMASVLEDGCVDHRSKYLSKCGRCQSARRSQQDRCRQLALERFSLLCHDSIARKFKDADADLLSTKFPVMAGGEYSLGRLMKDPRDCLSSLENLWASSGHSDGSSFFYNYGHRDSVTGADKRELRTPWQYIDGMKWQVLLPYNVVVALTAGARKVVLQSNKSVKFLVDVPVICWDGALSTLHWIESHKKQKGEKDRKKESGMNCVSIMPCSTSVIKSYA
jgi:hypothetical protein